MSEEQRTIGDERFAISPYRLTLLAVFLLAFALRVWDLPRTPPGLWYDEAYNVMDAVWAVETGNYPLFFVGNNGREPMWHYLLMAATSLLGRSTFTVRWVGAMAGFLTIPVLYRFARLLLMPFVVNRREARWLALAAAAWLTVSWWHLLNSRAGFRPVLLPPLLMLSLYFFWRGLRTGSGDWGIGNREGSNLQFILSGLFLGLAQYTYLPARLSPLIFIALAVSSVLQPSSPVPEAHSGVRGGVRRLSLVIRHLALTGFASAVVFAPLGFYFWQNPDQLFARTGDVAFVPKTAAQTAAHLWQAVTLFLGAGHELYRHHLPGRAMLGWLEIPFFWLGLVSLLRPSNLRRPQTHLLLAGLGVMWLPALLASPPVHALRPIGLLPFYYLIVTLGLYVAIRLPRHVSGRLPLFPVLAVIVITLNGLTNTYDYFVRWANHPDVYREYNGPLVDLTRQIVQMTRQQDVIIPFHLYVHPTVRYLLYNSFPEQAGPPPDWHKPARMLIVPNTFELLFVGNIPNSPAMVRLTRDPSGRGAAYVSRPPRLDEQEAIDHLLAGLQPRLEPFRDRLGRTVALFTPLPDPPQALIPLFNPAPLRTVNLTWAGQVALTGYDVTPVLARPGQPIYLNLYWRSLTEKTFDERLFLQLIDAAGNPVNQWEGTTFNEDMYRWRPAGLLPTRHTLWLGPEAAPGTYLVRLGFFNDRTGNRLPLQTDPPADQVQLGLFYVTPHGTAPRPPAVPLAVTFGNAITLIGVTLPALSNPQSPISQSPNLPVIFHWQALHPTDSPYTVFLQLLNEQGKVVSGWDSQPFGGLYPTSLWSPGEVIVDTFTLPLPESGLPPGEYRLITGFYQFETGVRLTLPSGADFAELARFRVPAP